MARTGPAVLLAVSLLSVSAAMCNGRLGRLTTCIAICAGAEHIFVRSSDAVEYAVEQQLAGNKGEKGAASAI